MKLEGKHVVMVGGFGGIGQEAAKCFLQKQINKLAILDVRSDDTALKQLHKDYPNTSTIYIPLDVTNRADIKAVFKRIIEEFKYIDILVNSGGVLNDSDPELTINVNLLGVINTTLTAFSYMSKAKGGKGGLVVNIASVLGLEPCPPLAVYTASKHGVIGFTRSMACDQYYEETGISLMAICPGVTDTNLIQNLEGKTTLPSTLDLLKSFILGQQKPEECARNIIEAIEVAKNGAIWTSDYGKLEEVHPIVHWAPH